MAHVISIPPQPIQSLSGKFTVHQVPAATDNIIWLIEYAPNLCAVVDGPCAKEALKYCEENALEITTILNTHNHSDHIGINHDLGSKGLIKDIRVIGSEKKKNEIPFITETVQDGSSIELGDISGTVWLTEGHIDGHICYIFEEFLFCGDTMFAGGCGYLFDGPAKKMFLSLSRLSSLPDNTNVCCAHEYTQDNLLFAYSVEPTNPILKERMISVWKKRKMGQSSLPSTILVEKKTNPFIRVSSLEIKDSLRTTFPDIDLVKPEQVFAYLRKHKDSKKYKKMSLPIFLE
jgi:hydroxyacylglutathione hydrolase